MKSKTPSENSTYLAHEKLLAVNYDVCDSKGLRHYMGSYIEFEISLYRSSSPEVFLGKGVLKICSKFTGEHPTYSLIVNYVCSISDKTPSKFENIQW